MDWIFKVIVFLSAFILFQIELIATQRLLPYFGGSFQVWSTCLVFYNLVLLFGYATVDYLGEKLVNKVYPKIHTLLIFLGAVFFQFNFISDHSSSDSYWPILTVLFMQIGLPFYLLSMTLPLTQAWCSKLSLEKSYHLYFYSGLGSVLGLVSYPIFNIFIGLSDHWNFLSILYLIFGLCFIPVAFFQKDTFAHESHVTASPSKLIWIFGAFVTCFLMLSVTNIVSQLIGSIPLVWIIPLMIFLLSFMLVFRPWFSEKVINKSMLVWGVLFILTTVVESLNYRMLYFAMILLCLYSFLFLACTIINHELYKIRPTGKTSHFNLYLNLGGLAATVVVSFGLPMIGRMLKINHLEVYLSLFFLVTFLSLCSLEKLKQMKSKRWMAIGFVLFLIFTIVMPSSQKEIAYFRNFYNTIRLIEIENHRMLVNGEILHGGQFITEDKKAYPLHYYHPKAPFGDLMHILQERKTVGVVGLGIGSMAYYARENEEWKFYEIDADMEHVARNYFSYLSTSPSTLSVQIGDGRLLLKNDPALFDLIVIDAFSGDAVPAHLVTKEATELYLKKLSSPDGVVVFHVSNIFINLLSVIKPIAQDLGVEFRYAQRSLKDELGESNSYWCVLTLNKKVIDQLEGHGWKSGEDIPSTRPWSDDYISFLHPMYLMLSSY